MKKQIFLYIVLTYGENAPAKFRNLPAAAVQLRSLQTFSRRFPDHTPVFGVDYARRIEGLKSIPRLQKALLISRKGGGGIVLIDDIFRLFRICEIKDRKRFFDELCTFKRSLFSLRHSSFVEDLNEAVRNLLVYHPEKVKSLRQQSGRSRTESARAASLAERASKAILIFDKLNELREELTLINGAVSLAEIATEANIRGLTTARGGMWTAQNVHRVLSRHE